MNMNPFWLPNTSTLRHACGRMLVQRHDHNTEFLQRNGRTYECWAARRWDDPERAVKGGAPKGWQVYFWLHLSKSGGAFLSGVVEVNTGLVQTHPRIHEHTLTYIRWMFAAGVAGKKVWEHQNKSSLALIFPSDLLWRSLDAPAVLGCLPAPLMTFTKLYIQNEILSLQESTFWEPRYNL